MCEACVGERVLTSAAHGSSVCCGCLVAPFQSCDFARRSACDNRPVQEDDRKDAWDPVDEIVRKALGSLLLDVRQTLELPIFDPPPRPFNPAWSVLIQYQPWSLSPIHSLLSSTYCHMLERIQHHPSSIVKYAQSHDTSRFLFPHKLGMLD